MLFGFGDKLRKLLDGVTLSDATRLVDPLKAKKSAEEIELIRMAGQMQDEILAKVQGQIKAGKKDFELLAYGHYIGNLLGSETGYMLGSSVAARTADANPRPPRAGPHHARRRRHLLPVREHRPGRHDDPRRALLRARQGAAGAGRRLRHHLRGAGQHRADAAARRVAAQEIFAEHNAFMQKHGMHKEPRLHCHGQGYDVVERPLIRHDEDMALGTSMNIGLHPTFGNARLFVTVCDNFLIGPDGKIENLHKTPRKIFEL